MRIPWRLGLMRWSSSWGSVASFLPLSRYWYIVSVAPRNLFDSLHFGTSICSFQNPLDLIFSLFNFFYYSKVDQHRYIISLACVMTYMFHTFMQVLSTGFVHPDFSVHAAADGSDGQPDVYRVDNDCAQPPSIEPATSNRRLGTYILLALAVNMTSQTNTTGTK